jgi:diacylglycerol kinase family enzyme
LGVLPLGTLNHFAKDNGIPLELDAAVASLLNGKLMQVDVGEVNGHIFINNSSIGLYPRIVQWREAEQDRGAGKWLAFLQAATFAFYSFAKLNIRVVAPGNRQTALRTPFVFIGNNKYEITGLKAGSRERLDRGLLWVHAAPDTGRVELAGLALKTLAGLHSRREWYITESDKAEIDFRGRALKVSVDGEVIELASPLRDCTRPRALKLIVPGRTAAS